MSYTLFVSSLCFLLFTFVKQFTTFSNFFPGTFCSIHIRIINRVTEAGCGHDSTFLKLNHLFFLLFWTSVGDWSYRFSVVCQLASLVCSSVWIIFRIRSKDFASYLHRVRGTPRVFFGGGGGGEGGIYNKLKTNGSEIQSKTYIYTL